MKIVDLLKTNDDIRLTCGYRWLIWNPVSKSWEVRQKKHREKITQLVLATENEEKAVDALKKG